MIQRPATRALLAAILAMVLSVVATAAFARESTQPLTLRTVLPDADIRTRADSNIEVEFVKADEPWVREVVSRCDAARRVVNRATGDALMITIRVVFAPDKVTFVKLVGDWAENSSAVAVPDTRQVVINADSMRKGPAGTLGTTLQHELAHLWVGVRCEKPIPRWLNEGIAMRVAGEWQVEDGAAVVMAKSIGGLIPLREIQHSFPVQADRQRLAYRQSHSVVEFIESTRHQGALPAMLAAITGQRGVAQIDRYWDSLFRETLEQEWRKSLNLSRNWPLLTMSDGIFWGIGALLLVAAWVAVKWRRRRRHAQWDEEDRVYAALDEAERDLNRAELEEAEESVRESREQGEARPPWYGGGA
jgi:hypothetical protein